jgi:hypothetical protein
MAGDRGGDGARRSDDGGAVKMQPATAVQRVWVLERLRTLTRQPGMRRCPGQPVDVLMPSDLPVTDPTFLVSGKVDGTRLLLCGFPSKGSRTVDLYMVDRAMMVYQGGHISSSSFVKIIHHRPFVLDTDIHATTMWVYDVVVFKGRPCLWGARAFLNRIKFAVPLVQYLKDALPGCCGLDIGLKEFYDVKSVEWLCGQEEQQALPYPTDGLVFVNREFPRSRPLKWKPPGAHTCDFRLVGGLHLYLEAPGNDDPPVYIDDLPEPYHCCAQHHRSHNRGPGEDGGEPPIVECRYVVGGAPQNPNPETKLPHGCWEVVHERWDKDRANPMQVYDRNVTLINANIGRGDLVLGPQHLQGQERDEDYYCEPGAAEEAEGAVEATDYYHKDAVKRWNSKSLPMKNFHNNVVKGLHCYKKYGEMAKQVLELGIGRGADVRRIVEHCPNLIKLVGVDKSKTALAEAQKRWFQTRCTADSAFERVDLTSPFGCEMFMRKHETQFDLVLCHFAVHYFSDTVTVLVDEVLKTGGTFVCTVFDGKAVREMLRAEPDQKKEWAIDGELQTSLQLHRDEQHVDVFIDSIGRTITEPLVDVEAFVQDMKGCNLVLEERRGFASFDGGAEFSTDHVMRDFSNYYCLLAFSKSSIRDNWDFD